MNDFAPIGHVEAWLRRHPERAPLLLVAIFLAWGIAGAIAPPFPPRADACTPHHHQPKEGPAHACR